MLPSGFYKLSYQERINTLKKHCGLSDDEFESLVNTGALSVELLETFVENSIGTFGLPLGIATNFVINGKEYLIPMAVEESSVIAAASYGAKLAKAGGGFVASASQSIMSGQIQLFVNSSDVPAIELKLLENKSFILNKAHTFAANLEKYGGGVVDVYWYHIAQINNLIIMLDVNTANAMGANIINTICEGIAPTIEEITGCKSGIKILTNLSTKRIAKSECKIPVETLTTSDFDGIQVAQRIYEAYLFAKYDMFRACTHNKGIMNGIDPVVIATGNDWRAVEAAAHAYACKDGKYTSLTQWSIDFDNKLLYGRLELPLAVGTVGGVTKLHPTARACLKLLGNPSSQVLSEIICSVGLAQNLSALRALAAEGIQKGHMKLHQKNLDLMKKLK